MQLTAWGHHVPKEASGSASVHKVLACAMMPCPTPDHSVRWMQMIFAGLRGEHLVHVDRYSKFHSLSNAAQGALTHLSLYVCA